MPTGPFCAGCPQQPIGQKCVKPDGQGTNGILIVGESPWKDELRLDRPFAGAAGHRLDRWLQLLGQQRDAFTISNAMWCAPPRLGWFQTREAQAAIAHCAPHLDALIEQRKPKVILALGNTALQRLCGVSGLDEHHSYVHDSRYGVPVIPTYHPSYVMQGNQKLTGAVLFAFRRALQLAEKPFQRAAVDYLLHPTIDALRDYFADWQPSMPLAFDIETAYSSKLKEDETEEDASFTIVRASCSWREHSAATFPWSEPFISWARELLARAGVTIFWNHSFDVPRLEAAGVNFTGEIVDAMWMFHWLQSDLPKSLGFVAPLYSDLSAWKHLSDAEPERYSAMDVDATLRCYYGIRRDIEAQGRWEMFERHCTRTSPLLREMGNKGLLIDLERQAKFKERLEVELAAAQTDLQSLVPTELKPVHPKEGYKREPKDTAGMEQCEFPVAAGDSLPSGEKAAYAGTIKRWCKRLPFNPDSPKQVADLITHLKLPLPKNRKTGADSTGAKYLSRFAKKHSVFRSILDCRQRGDMLSTFIWPVAADGRISTQYGFHPSTWRKSSRSVNLQNIPKRAELAKEFRKMLVAAPGHVLIEGDSSAIEAVLVGYCANDPDYIRAAKAGIHSFITSHFVKEPVSLALPDTELIPALREVKLAHPKVYEVAKRGGHSTNYLVSAYGLHDEFPDYFSTTRVGEEFQEFYFGLFPRIKEWHKSTLERAHKENRLDNHFAYRHWFWDVFAYDGKSREWRLGQDAKRAVAFVPQSDASAIQTEYLLTLAADERIRPHLRLIIHDSIVLEVPEKNLDIACAVVHDVMTRPFGELGSLAIGAELSTGPSLGEMVVWQGALA